MNRSDFVASLIDDKCDPTLGWRIHTHLKILGIESLVNPHDFETAAEGPTYTPKRAFEALRDAIHLAYKNLGLDVENDPSIKETPTRFAKMFVGELTKGLNYDFFPKCTATPNGSWKQLETPSTRNPVGPKDSIIEVPTGRIDEAVIVKKIRVTSLCEHHLQTIDGFAHIAYIPKDKVLGLSKFARVAEFFASRPQIQERMTEQIFHALSYILETEDIAVVIDATHFCMRARGVRQPESTTQTNKVGGRFLTNPSLRKEFLDAIALA